MIKISIWARKNFILSRILIIIGFLFLYLLCFFTGNALRDLQLIIPFSVLIVSSIIFIVTASVYILQKHVLKKQFSYLYHKTLDGFLLISTYLILLTVYNHYGSVSNMFSGNSSYAYGSFAPSTNSSLEFSKENTSIKPVKVDKKSLKQTFKKMIKAYKEKSTGSKGILIFLSILLAVVLLLALAALACSISCSGSGVLGLLVFVAGTFGIVLGLVKLIERIKKGPKEPKSSE